MKYRYTIFYVEDVVKTLEFYKKAFGFSQKMMTPEKDYAELNTGGTILAFASLNLADSNFKKGFQKITNHEKPIGMEIAFVTESIEKDFEKAIAAGAVEFEKITKKPWGQKVGYLRDLNGILIEICTPMGS